MHDTNVDPKEVDKFGQLASRWWDPAGEFKPLHRLNPVRMAFIEQHTSLEDMRTLDVGCGGGILSESLAGAGAKVTGIDASDAVIQVAKLHLHNSGHHIDYHTSTAEAFAQTQPMPFNVITCMELLEHVPDPKHLIQSLSALLADGGYCFLSTLNRTIAAYLGAIIGAEYVLGILPKGTHDYARFIRPAELSHWLRDAGLSVKAITGVGYNPLTHQAHLSKRVSINYFVVACKER